MKSKMSVVAGLILAASAARAQQPDFSKVEIKASKVAGSVWMLEGMGGNIGVSVGPDGLLIVDDQFAPLADKIRAALKGLGEGKLRFILNTHWHGDHTGGNASFGAEAPILAHSNVRKRLAAGGNARGRVIEPAPPAALPVITFDQSLSLHFNGEEIKVLHTGPGHTDGDSIIHFTGSNVVHLGDHMFNGRFPFIDLDSGGSVEGYIKNVADAIAKIPADARLIPGHGPLATLADLKKFHQALLETTGIVKAARTAGKTLEETQKAGFPAAYRDWGSGFINSDAWVQIIWRSLEGPGKK